MLPMPSDLHVEAKYIKGVSSIGPLACQSMCSAASVKLANSFSSNQQVFRASGISNARRMVGVSPAPHVGANALAYIDTFFPLHLSSSSLFTNNYRNY